MKHKFFFYPLILLLIFSGLCAIFAKTPTTAKIVFTSQPNGKQKGNRDIYIMNPDGTEQVNLTRHKADDFQPTWSPRGERVLFTSDRAGITDLFLMNADGTNVQQVFQKRVGRQAPTWAPDGKRIAYFRFDARRDEAALYIAAIDGTGEEHIANGWHPTWAPDGSEIAFVSLENLEIRTINLETGVEDTVLPMPNAIAFDPAWSPDGTKIAFTRLNPLLLILGGLLKAGEQPLTAQTIYTVNRDGSQLEQIVFDDTKAAKPAWSPRGNEIVYHQPAGKDLQLFKITVGSRVSQQLTDRDSNTDPDWFDPKALSVAPQPHLLTTMWGKMK